MRIMFEFAPVVLWMMVSQKRKTRKSFVLWIAEKMNDKFVIGVFFCFAKMGARIEPYSIVAQVR